MVVKFFQGLLCASFFKLRVDVSYQEFKELRCDGWVKIVCKFHFNLIIYSALVRSSCFYIPLRNHALEYTAGCRNWIYMPWKIFNVMKLNRGLWVLISYFWVVGKVNGIKTNFSYGIKRPFDSIAMNLMVLGIRKDMTIWHPF